MQLQKLDRKRNFGTVFNHDRIAYEQDGKQFDASGIEIEQSLEKIVQKRESEPKPASKKGKLTPNEFLGQLLAGGPIAQSVVKKAAEGAKLPWADVQLAAIDLGVEKYKQGPANIWKLGEAQ